MLRSFPLGLTSWKSWLVRHSIGLPRLERLYARVKARTLEHGSTDKFFELALAELQVSYTLPGDSLKALAKLEGPLLFVANHPYGGLDALLLMVLMARVRPAFKLLGNSILEAIPELTSVLIPMDIQDGKKNMFQNSREFRKLIRELKRGGCLGMFPAGEVDRLSSWRNHKAVELSWHPHLGRIVRMTEATVIPVYFHGRNTFLSHYLGLIFPRLRIPLLIREMGSRGKVISFRIGNPILFADSPLPKICSASDLSLSLQLINATHPSDAKKTH